MRIHHCLSAAAAVLSISAGAADPAPDTVLVKRGDTVVTVGDFFATLERIPENQRFTYRADVDRIASATSSIYVMRTLAAEARAQGIDKEPDVQRRLRLAEETLLGQIVMERFEKAIVTPDFEARAREMYRANPERFEIPAKFKLHQVVVSTQGRSDDEALRRAEEVRAKLLAGEPFSKVAHDYTNDPNYRTNNGLVSGPYNLLPDPVAAAARTVPLGKPSEAISTNRGYYVIVVDERLPSGTVPYEKAKVAMIEQEKNKFRKAALDEKLKAITNSTEITIDTDAIASLKTEIDQERMLKLHVEQLQREKDEKERLIREAAKPAGS
jgi:parvulin-like peptidyl-prolyl isomerase